ncbi:MAG: hypothetical protein EZS28_030466 [Streblomastix strix]|uniref:Protein kinase domain-containing protein n=1 Tax=Streblomastix strix TaxID=222440 RepID=A0A5J4UUD5_9EUKA|nr:MAG: hypothetical protein EZS28_030466 [Streblomastix strix]
MLHTGKDDKSRVIRGTPPFLAPEVVTQTPTSEPYATRPVDIWAAGVTLFMMLFGRPPFKGKTMKDTFRLIATQKLVLPNKVSPLLDDFLHKILDKNPETRITCEEMRYHDWLTMNGQWPFPEKKSEAIKVQDEDLKNAYTNIDTMQLLIGIKMKMGMNIRRARTRLKSEGIKSQSSSSKELNDGKEQETVDEDIDDEMETFQTFGAIPGIKIYKGAEGGYFADEQVEAGFDIGDLSTRRSEAGSRTDRSENDDQNQSRVSQMNTRMLDNLFQTKASQSNFNNSFFRSTSRQQFPRLDLKKTGQSQSDKKLENQSGELKDQSKLQELRIAQQLTPESSDVSFAELPPLLLTIADQQSLQDSEQLRKREIERLKSLQQAREILDGKGDCIIL